jgi:hypothetical protein
MNELETYVVSLQDQGLSVDEIKAKVIEWKKNNKQEVVETSVEPVKTEDGAVGASAPSVGPQPAPEPTELTLEDGFSVSPEDKIKELDREAENILWEGYQRAAKETKAKEKEIATMSFGEKLLIDFKKGSTTLGEMIASVPETIYDLFALPQNLLANATGLDIEASAEKFKEKTGLENPVLEFYEAESAKLQESQDIYNKANYDHQGIYKNFEEGNYVDGFKQLASGLAESAPVSMSMMIGGAAVSTGKLAAGSTIAFAGPEIKEQREKNVGQSEAENIIKGLGLAGAESVFSSIGTGTIGKVYKDILIKEGKEEGVKIFRQGLVDMYRSALTKFGAPASMVGEGVEEVATTITQNMINGVDPFENVADSFIQGVGGGLTYGAPINSAQAVKAVKSGITNLNINKELKTSDSNNVIEAFNPETPTSEAEIKISQIPGSLSAIDAKADKQVEVGDITIDQANDVKLRAREVQGSVNRLKPLGISVENQPAIVDLMIEQKKLKNTIKQVDNSSLTKAESERLSEIDKELNDIIVADKTAKVEKGAKVIAEQVGTGFETFENEADMASAIETLKEQGGKVDVKNSQDYGSFVVMPDGKKIVILNKESAAEDNVMDSGGHEIGHVLVYETVKNNPEAAIALGTSLLEELKNSKDITFTNSRFLDRFNQYVEDADISKADTMEEVLTLSSEGLANGDIVFNEKASTKIGDFIRRALSAMGLNVKFKTGKDVLNFVRDYNRSIQKGKGLSKGLEKAAIEGAKVDIKAPTDIEAEATDIVAKESKKDTGAIASTSAQDLAVKSKSKEGLTKKEEDNLVEQVQLMAIEALGYKQGKGTVSRDKALGFVNDYIPGILRRFKPVKNIDGKDVPQQISTFVYRNIQPKQAKFYEQEIGTKSVETSISDERQKELESIEDTSRGPAIEVDTDVKLVDNIKIDGKPLDIPFKDKVRGFVTEQLKNVDINSEKFRKQVFKPSKDFVDFIVKDLIGNPKQFREFLNSNPTFYKGLSITDLVAIDDGRVKKGQPRLFTEPNRRLTKQADIEKFMMQGRIPYLTTTQQKAGAVLYNRLNPKVAAVINNFFGSTPQNNSNRKRAIAKAIANKFIAEATPSTEAFKAKPQLDKAKIAERLQVSQQAKFSKRSAGSQYNVDSNVINAGYKPIKPGVEGVADLSDFLVNDLTKVFGKNASLFVVASNLAGAGNSYIGSKPTSGAKGRKFLFISDINKTKKYIKETREALESGELGDLKVINNTISALEGLDAISESDLKAIKQAISSQTIKNIEGNLKNKSLHDKGVRLIIEKLAELYKLDPKNIRGIAAMIYNQNANYSFGRKMAAVLGLEQGVEAGSKSWEEHVYQFGNFANRTLEAISSDNPKVLDGWIKWVNDNYYQEVTGKETQAIVDATYFKDGITWKAKSEEHPYLNEKLNEAFETGDFSEVPPADIRKYNEYFALNPNNRSINGVSDAAKYNVEVDAKFRNNLDVQAEQQRLIYEQFIGETTAEKAKQDIKVYTALAPGKAMASKRDSDLIPDAIKYDRPITVQTAINALAKTDKSLELARKLDQPVKKIRVFDFDDTLARTKSNVLYTMPDGTTGKIDAATFAKEAGNMEAEGAQWDFSEFSKVMEGKKGPLLDVAKIIAEKRGTKDVFVLTARPANAAGPIKEFLASMGLDIPLANITGLGDGTPEAKAGWIMGKAAEGYNDFYFADDHTGNVKAVKDVLSQIDVKSKVQLAKASKRQTFDTVVNDMIEDSSGIEAYKKYSAARAKTVGASKGKYNFLIPPSAEDFTGLLYKMIGKGKKGDAQMAFLKTNLLDTYNRAESAVTQAKISAANDFKALKTKLKTLPKTLSKETGIGKFTYSHAVRVAAWTKQGMDIPGLSKRDIKELNDFVNKDAKLRVFTDELIKIQKGKEYPKPDKEWLGGNITTDIIGGINKVNRAEYQQEWRENIDIIFSEDNLNKMEAAYGTRWREAMVDSIRRMKAGTNRPIGGNRVTEGLLDWLNNSVGAVMFLNTRSALLQTISAVNFINWGDNNIIKAGRAFANQKQFWGDFMTLMNSDYLVERRNGLKINVSESEIADAVRESKNKPKAAIAFLLSKGFVMTRFADSFAIASGGSTFYRNRLEALKKQGLSDADAAQQAFEDFKAIAEENQQSSAPSKISQQQASAAGRVILAWANTPMQYARIQKRAAQDLINGRGDWKSNVSKIVYYGAIQNLIFNSLQQAVFALGFGDDEEETDEAKAKKKEEKAYKIANGMIDSQLKGLGIFGAASAAVKNTLMTLYEEYGKKGSKYENAVDDLLSFSPPLGSKIGKIKGGLRSFSWNMKDMKEKGFSLDNPAYMAGAQVVTGFTNIPLDRVAKKINNLRGLVNERSSLWQKVALGLGWGTWELGLGYYGGFDKQKPLTPKQQLQLEVDTMKKDTSKADQVKTLLDFGLTKKQIRELKNENNRVKKILELQKKDKDAGSKK